MNGRDSQDLNPPIGVLMISGEILMCYVHVIEMPSAAIQRFRNIIAAISARAWLHRWLTSVSVSVVDWTGCWLA